MMSLTMVLSKSQPVHWWKSWKSSLQGSHKFRAFVTADGFESVLQNERRGRWFEQNSRPSASTACSEQVQSPGQQQRLQPRRAPAFNQ